MALGFVYVFTNPIMPGIVKIGTSSYVPERRAEELSEPTSIPMPFEIEYWCLTTDAANVEQSVHELLQYCRVTPQREFFAIDALEAIAVIEKVAKIVPSSFYRQRGSGVQVVACPFCGVLSTNRMCAKCGGVW